MEELEARLRALEQLVVLLLSEARPELLEHLDDLLPLHQSKNPPEAFREHLERHVGLARRLPPPPVLPTPVL